MTLYQELRRPRLGPQFERVWGGWEARIGRPDVDRMEYLLVLEHSATASQWAPDPDNRLRAPGPFGEKSVVEFPGYQTPAWVLSDPAPSGRIEEIQVDSVELRRTLSVDVWTCAGHGPDEALPLLLAFDGPEYALYSGLLALLDRQIADGLLPPLHAALLAPADRDEEYSGSPSLVRALERELIPAIEAAVRVRPGRDARLLMGASLGGLAALHVQRVRPALVGGVFCQSASFFRSGPDDHESHMARFRRIVRFVDGVIAGGRRRDPVPVVLTCGTVEENLAGNRQVAEALVAQGYPAQLAAVRDAHNWTAWRDSLDPHLTGLITRLFG